MTPWLLASVISVFFVSLLLVAEARALIPLKVVAKSSASATFVICGLLADPFSSLLGIFIFSALVLGAVGDLCLLSTSRQSLFLGGLAAFLLSHLCYAAAFVRLHQNPAVLFLVLIIQLWLGLTVYRNLARGIEPPMRRPVQAYILVICVMSALAFGAWAAGAHWILPLAATAFWLSDISVARDRFLEAGFLNKAWGIPLYFGAQMLFAHSLDI